MQRLELELQNRMPTCRISFEDIQRLEEKKDGSRKAKPAICSDGHSKTPSTGLEGGSIIDEPIGSSGRRMARLPHRT